jgi:poly(3-hydroxybutyrate) depolymerase
MEISMPAQDAVRTGSAVTTRGTRLPNRLLLLAVALTLLAVPGIRATAHAADSAVTAAACDTTPTAGAEARHPYLDRQAAATIARNPAYSYGQNPYVYTLFVPAGLPDGPVPLLLGFHGLGQSATNYQDHGLMELATREGFIVAFPSGVRSWWATEDSQDVKFVRDIVADIRTERCIDARRIWATGASNGAFMAQRLACDAGDLFAAIAVHAGTPADGTFPFGGPCRANEDKAPGFETLPVWWSHGTADSTVDIATGKKAFRSWLNRYQCDTVPLEVLPDQFGSTARYSGCRRADVVARQKATGVPFELIFRTLQGHEHLYPDGCGGAGECESPGSQFPTADDQNNQLFAFLAQHARTSPAAEQGEPDLTKMPVRDPVRYANWAPTNEYSPHTDLAFVDESGAHVATRDAVESQVVRVEFVAPASSQYPAETFDNPRCPTTSPGSGKIRIVGRPVVLRVIDARGTAEYVAQTAEQPGTGLAVATFQLPKKARGRTIVVEATTDRDLVRAPALCTAEDSRFQETLSR